MQALSKPKESRIVGETLPSQQRAYRVRVVEASLRKSIPLAKVNGLRDLPEKNALRQTTGVHLSQYIPIDLEEERRSVQKEIRGRPVSIIFDGMSRTACQHYL